MNLYDTMMKYGQQSISEYNESFEDKKSSKIISEKFFEEKKLTIKNTNKSKLLEPFHCDSEGNIKIFCSDSETGKEFNNFQDEFFLKVIIFDRISYIFNDKLNAKKNYNNCKDFEDLIKDCLLIAKQELKRHDKLTENEIYHIKEEFKIFSNNFFFKETKENFKSFLNSRNIINNPYEIEIKIFVSLIREIVFKKLDDDYFFKKILEKEYKEISDKTKTIFIQMLIDFLGIKQRCLMF